MIAFTLKMLMVSGLVSVETPQTPPNCRPVTYEAASYTVCSFRQSDPGLRLFLLGPDGEPFGHFTFLNDHLTAKDERLVFAMNAGMYHEDRAPVGLYIEDGETLAPLQTGEGYGNFHLLPNGVFYIENGIAHVFQTSAYQALAPDPDFATQSGPMLVIDGDIHPAFRATSTSFKRRNGVGVNEDTGEVFFVLSDGFVNFHTFASLFRDHLGAKQALYLDGTISRLYAPDIHRNDVGVRMGPIVAVTRSVSEEIKPTNETEFR